MSILGTDRRVYRNLQGWVQVESKCCGVFGQNIANLPWYSDHIPRENLFTVFPLHMCLVSKQINPDHGCTWVRIAFHVTIYCNNCDMCTRDSYRLLLLQNRCRHISIHSFSILHQLGKIISYRLPHNFNTLTTQRFPLLVYSYSYSYFHSYSVVVVSIW